MPMPSAALVPAPGPRPRAPPPPPTLFAALLLLVALCAPTATASVHILDDTVPREKAKMPKLKPPYVPPEITHKVYLDVVVAAEDEHDEAVEGRITLGLYGKVAPRTVENFRSLCACDGGNGKISGQPLCYKGTTFHRIIPNFMVQGGNVLRREGGGGGESIYGGYFDDESHEVPHNKLYTLSMANTGPNTNGSQFFINTVKTSWLDGRNVAFGTVLAGFEIVDEIEAVGTNSGRPQVEVKIVGSGVLEGSPAKGR